MKRQEPDLLFVALREPASLRRDVLMGTKDVLDCLKRYEEYKRVKLQKQNALAQLSRVFADIQSLNRRLQGKLPRPPVSIDVRDRELDAPLFVREREGKDISGPSPSVARPKSKLDALQAELEKIESRLGALE